MIIDSPPGNGSPIGSAYIRPDGYLAGAPELVAEIAASSASYDLREKKETYQIYGVQEYIVWQIYDPRIDCFHLMDGKYAAPKPDDDGLTRNQVFPELLAGRGGDGRWPDDEGFGRSSRGSGIARTQCFCRTVEERNNLIGLIETDSPRLALIGLPITNFD